MGGGASPLNTGGGMGGQNQTFGTMGGFGGNLGTAGTLGGQQNTIYGSVPFNNSQNQQPALTMMPQNQGPYTGPTDPSAVVNRLGNISDFFQQQQMGQQQQGGLQPSQQPLQSQQTAVFGGNLVNAGTPGARFDSSLGQQQAQRYYQQQIRLQQQRQQQQQQPLQPPQQVAQPMGQQPDIASIFGNLTQRQQSPSPFNQRLPSSTTQAPQGYDSYGFDKNVVDYLDKQRQNSAFDAGVAYQYDPQTQMFTGSTMGGQVRKSLADIQREASGGQQYQQPYSPRMSMDMPQGLQPLQGQFSYPGLQEPGYELRGFPPRQAPQQQPDMSTAIGQLKGGDQFAAQNTMRQLVGLPPLQAPAYNANPTMSDAINLQKSGDQASAQDMMRRIVGLPATGAPNQRMSPAPAAPQGIQSLMQARPPRRRFGRM
jgi:hypothetical protein